MKKKKQEGKLFTIRAYCTDCGKMLLESNPMTRLELLVNWDQAVLSAPNIPCDNCGHKVPNFHIRLRIHDKRGNKEYNPSIVIPKPKNTVTFEGLEQVLQNFKSK